MPASPASTDTQKQSSGHVLERSLQTLLRAGQLDVVWEMLQQVYPQLEVGTKWCLHPASRDRVGGSEVATLQRQDLP